MDNEFSMDYTLSKEAQKTIADLFDICQDNNTDTVTMEIDCPSAILEVEISFRVIKKGKSKWQMSKI